MTQSVLILGAQGMLGQSLVEIFNSDDRYSVTAWDREDIDVTDEKRLRGEIATLWPDIIINATAYNAVDMCEEDDQEYKKARELNSIVPGNLASIASGLQAVFVHYSTDYVFDGERPHVNGQRGPGCCGQKCDGCQYRGNEETVPYWQYQEIDDPHPISRYGHSKRDGEIAVEKNGSRYYIIRLSKLFGRAAQADGAKRSFFDVMFEAGRKAQKTGSVVKAVDDEVSCFTYAPDLAAETKSIIEDGMKSGIYHGVNSGACTWFEAAQELYAIKELEDVVLEPVGSDAFPRAAKRPSSSVLKTKKRPPLRDYRDALKEHITSL